MRYFVVEIHPQARPTAWLKPMTEDEICIQLNVLSIEDARNVMARKGIGFLMVPEGSVESEIARLRKGSGKEPANPAAADALHYAHMNFIGSAAPADA